MLLTVVCKAEHLGDQQMCFTLSNRMLRRLLGKRIKQIKANNILARKTFCRCWRDLAACANLSSLQV